ncbi:flagellar biosynthetic protein FliO [Pseudoduganella namucuonensis]|uniref:Flagellar biosynthesis protein, FliO n=1 Tax=Pseudoduganella namucuonensis TaxID=1035707 RepID=A0A1I7M3V8_9BURK|nr:flagellar biosynthetic protein FliO [Pseudoduganella namucuonensis]SFV16636.1 Flagellar biosynthesis protein, FliO [Pseudoduganella namucuonensis]
MTRRWLAAMLGAAATLPYAAGALAAQAEAAASVPAASAASAAAIPFKRTAAVPAEAISGGAVGVVLISLAAIVVVYVLRKRLKLAPAGPSEGALRIVETQRLGPRTLLSVVEFSGGRYLIAQGEHGVTCLASAPTPPDAAPAAPEQAR